MCEEELFGLSLEGQCGSLRSGAMELFGGNRGKGVVEGTFETKKVDTLDVGENCFGVGGISAVGVSADRILAARFLFDKVAVGGDGMD